MLNDKEKELERKLKSWFDSQKYLVKIEILLEAYSKQELSISAIERQGLNNLWRTINLKNKKIIMEKYEKDERRKNYGN